MPAATLRQPERSVKSRQTNRSTWTQVAKSCPRGWTPVVAYYRNSGDKQDKSIESQRAEMLAWLEREKLCILWEYLDEGISGDDTRRRVAFQKMINDAESGAVDFQFIVCWDQDRFGRFDSLEAGRWIFPLREAGVVLRTPKGPISWNTFEERLLFTVQQEGKHTFLRDLSRNATRGKLSTARDGRWPGGPTPIGYEVERYQDPVTNRPKTGKLTTGDDQEVKMVMTIFDLYDGGKSLRGLAEHMNREFGPHPRSGGLWTNSTVRSVLVNPYYTGDFIFPKKSEGKYHCIRDGEVSDQLGLTGEQIFIADNHPAIVDREVFDRIQDKMEGRKRGTTPSTNGGDFLLSGLLFCQSCGARMTGKTCNGTHNGKKYLSKYYVCSNGAYRSGCHLNQIRQDDLVEEVVKSLEGWAADEEVQDLIQEVLSEIHEQAQQADPVDALKARRADLEKQLTTTRRRIATVDESLMPIIEETLKELQRDMQEVDRKLRSAEAPASSKIASMQNRYDEALTKMSDVRRLVKMGDPCRVRELLRDLIERIDVEVAHEKQGKRLRYRLVGGELTIHDSVFSKPSTDDTFVTDDTQLDEGCKRPQSSCDRFFGAFLWSEPESSRFTVRLPA